MCNHTLSWPEYTERHSFLTHTLNHTFTAARALDEVGVKGDIAVDGDSFNEKARQ